MATNKMIWILLKNHSYIQHFPPSFRDYHWQRYSWRTSDMLVGPLQLSNTSLSTQEWDSLVKALSQQKPSWSHARCGIFWLQKEYLSNHVWMETNLPVDHMMCEQEWKEQGQLFGFQDRFGGILHEAREERNKCSFDVSFSLHLCCLLSFSSLQHFDYQLLKGYHSQILTWHLSLFVHLRLLNIFCTDQTIQCFSELYRTTPLASV